MSFTGKVVIVTGAASGIGAATAELFAKEGSAVTIVDKDGKQLQIVADQLTKDGRKIHTMAVSVADDDDAKRIVKETVEKFGKLDVLINCAGILRPGTILGGTLMESYDKVMDINLRAVMQLTCLAAPHLIKTKGNIINISSVGATHAQVDFNAYCVSKIGVNHFTRGAALELAPHGVRVNSVSPGPVNTNIFVGSNYETQWSNWIDSTALKRVADPSEIADLLLFLASDKAKGITGSEYVYDNGYLIKN